MTLMMQMFYYCSTKVMLMKSSSIRPYLCSVRRQSPSGFVTSKKGLSFHLKSDGESGCEGEKVL